MTCVLCGDEHFYHVYVDAVMRVVQCQTCGLVFQPPDDVDADELNSYYRQRPTESRLRWSGSTNRLKDVIAEIVGNYPAGRLLDVGCGSGELLYVMAQQGLTCTGLEPNSLQSEYAKRQGLDVVNQPLKAGLFSPDSFDVVTLIQVFEHVFDPVQTLLTVQSYLRPGGMLVIDVPGYNNPRFLIYRATGIRRIVQRDFIRPHRFYYTPRTLSAIVQKSGLEIARWDCGRYHIKFGANPLFKAVDRIARQFQVGGIVMYARKPNTISSD